MSDIFREINEEVRRDRFSQMVRRYWKYAAIAAVLAIGAAVAYVLIEQQADARREAEEEVERLTFIVDDLRKTVTRLQPRSAAS